MSITFQQFGFRQRVCGIVSMMLLCLWCVSPAAVSAQEKKQKFHHDLFSVSFPTEKEGWACGRMGTVLHTSDGGKTWISQNTGTRFTLTSVLFVDSKQGWAVGDQGTIIHTVDGGKTWKPQQSPVDFFLMDVYFVTPLRGWVVAERTHILFTENGGKTWRVQFKDLDYILKALSFCDPLNGWAVGEYGYIYHTKNGGASWEKQGGYCAIEEKTGYLVGGDYLFDVVAVDPLRAWAVGIDSTIVQTVDGGKTWKKVDAGIPRTQLFCIASDKRNKIVVGGKGVFLSSVDMGQTWQSPVFKPPITYSWLYGLALRGSSEFVSVGWEGAIYLNTSNTWQRVSY